MDKLTWYKGSPREEKNFGDALNPELYKMITGKRVAYSKPSIDEKRFMMVGSIINSSKPRTTVWGAGVSRDYHIHRGFGGDIRAVRGPLTKKWVEKHGVLCPEVYGDPALLLPRYYTPNVEKKYKLGIIPHWIDYAPVKSKHPDITIIDLFQPWDKIVDAICQCDRVISSSLHGIIVADAYGIPARWCEFSDKVAGGGYKFHDYFQSVGEKEILCYNFRKKKIFDNPDEFVFTRNEINIDLDKLMDSCPFTLKKETPKPRTNYKVISFYCDPDGGSYYSKRANIMKKDCGKLGIDHDISELFGGNSWIKACQAKPKFILDKLEMYPDHDLLWVDVDSKLNGLPDIAPDVNWGVSKRYRNTPQSYVHFIKNTDENKQFIKRWMEAINKIGGGDHSAFISIFNDHDTTFVDTSMIDIGIAPSVKSKQNFMSSPQSSKGSNIIARN